MRKLEQDFLSSFLKQPNLQSYKDAEVFGRMLIRQKMLRIILQSFFLMMLLGFLFSWIALLGFLLIFFTFLKPTRFDLGVLNQIKNEEFKTVALQTYKTQKILFRFIGGLPGWVFGLFLNIWFLHLLDKLPLK